MINYGIVQLYAKFLTFITNLNDFHKNRFLPPVLPVNPSFTIYKWSVRGSSFHGHVFVMQIGSKFHGRVSMMFNAADKYLQEMICVNNSYFVVNEDII